MIHFRGTEIHRQAARREAVTRATKLLTIMQGSFQSPNRIECTAQLPLWERHMQASIDVLVVDDSDSHASITLMAIGRFAPQAAVNRLKDGEQALQFIFCRDGYSGRRPQMPRLILLELETPVRNGLHVLDALTSNSRTSEIPVIMLARTSTPFAIEQTYMLGARGYVVKPTDADEYCSAVGGILERWLPASGCQSPKRRPARLPMRQAAHSRELG
jgi:two-component system, response regulator